ncbi:MAG: NADH-quinone oxidoreductase subunit B [Arachnia sp.]
MEAWDWFGDGSLYVVDIPLACCALESQAATAGSLVQVPPRARVAVTLSGTITHAIAPGIRALIAELPVHPTIIAFGGCACVGGPYWDSYSVAPGAEAIGVEVDRFIAGCPPPPEAIEAALQEVRRG